MHEASHRVLERIADEIEHDLLPMVRIHVDVPRCQITLDDISELGSFDGATEEPS